MASSHVLARRFIHVQSLFDYLFQYVYLVICRSLHDTPLCPVRIYLLSQNQIPRRYLAASLQATDCFMAAPLASYGRECVRLDMPDFNIRIVTLGYKQWFSVPMLSDPCICHLSSHVALILVTNLNFALYRIVIINGYK